MTYNPEAVNDFASYIALAAALPAAAATLIYGIGSPWYKSWLGRTIFAQWLSIVLVFGVILGRRFFGTYPNYEWVAVIAYSLLFVTFSAMAVLVIIERRAPARARALIERTSAMSDNTPTPAAPTIWYKGQRVIRSVLAGLVVVVPVANATVPALAAAFNSPDVPVEVYVAVNGVALGVAAVLGVVSRIMAIPAVNNLLTKFGAGSVPKSAL